MKTYLKLINISVNFKYLVFFFIYVSCISCQNKEKKIQLGKELISENLPVLLDGLGYFKIAEETLTASVYQYVGRMDPDQETVIEKFQDKFHLRNQEIFDRVIKLENIPKKIDDYPIFIKTDYGAQKQRNVIEVVLGNLIISKDNQYAAIEVIKSLGIGAKFEIYYFKQVNGKWVPDGNEVIALG
ncbi:hypothetical protein [Chryseobacterium lactis]|uniref:hypothetical protein n=1 Tax=Chryseobacterium lactis TaxID=1241981 RepID=UPI001626C0B1|nr:hypothetical protein [Chryseobacterium lactis]